MKKSHAFVARIGLPCLLMVMSLFAFSQSRTITGQVTDQRNNKGLAGASVLVKGTSTGTTTNENGNYTIAVPSSESVLVFSYAGMGTQEIPVGNQSTINVQFSATSSSMDEVVVVGYGTRRKSDLTGSVGTVKASQLNERPAASLNEALAGRVAGV